MRIKARSFETEPGSISVDRKGQLVVLAGRDVGERFVVTDDAVVGRSKEADIQIDDDVVSRQHARITQTTAGTFNIHDLGSRNGTAVNGEIIEKLVLQFGDRVAMGGTVMLFLEHDEAQEQLLQQQKLQALGELASGVAHDFNNLIGAILASVTHMQELEASNDIHQGLRDVEHAARRAADFTARLLTFGSPRERKYRRVALGRIIDETKDLLQRTLSRNIKLTSVCDPELAVIGDDARLIQVVMNLCINAQDAMPQGGRLEIEAHKVRIDDPHEPDTRSPLGPGDYVELTVTDTGVGMEQDVADKIFRPFFTTKGRGQGTGLGLATVLAVVKGHGGQVSVKSKVGEGTQFTIHLPPAARVPAEERKAPDDTTGVTSIGLAATILAADDEPAVLRGLTAVLKRAGLDVVGAADGEEALRLFSERPDDFDVVVLDLNMPGLGGADCLARIRQASPQVPVLITTGYVTDESERELRLAGASGFVHKPYSAHQLREAVTRALASGCR